MSRRVEAFDPIPVAQVGSKRLGVLGADVFMLVVGLEAVGAEVVSSEVAGAEVGAAVGVTVGWVKLAISSFSSCARPAQ